MNYCILGSCGISAASSAAAEHTAGEITTKNLFQNRPQKHTWLWLIKFPLCRWEKSENSKLHSWHLAGLEPSPDTLSIGILRDISWMMTEHCKHENTKAAVRLQASDRNCSSEARVLGGAGGECEHPGYFCLCTESSCLTQPSQGRIL